MSYSPEAGTCGMGYPKGGRGAPHLHRGFLVGAVARWQLGLNDNHVGGRTLPSVPARAEPQVGLGIPSLPGCCCPPQSQDSPSPYRAQRRSRNRGFFVPSSGSVSTRSSKAPVLGGGGTL